MVGQKFLLNLINNFTLDNFPKSIILYGEYGCGKHTFAKVISEKFGLELKQLDEISNDIIIDATILSKPYLYLIDGDNLTIKQQNVLLKTIEEPLKNTYIIIITEHYNNLLETIVDRCSLLKFDYYLKDELLQFVPEKYKNNNKLLPVCPTPGKLLKISKNNIDFEDIYKFGIKILENIKLASLANTLTIAKKINFKDDFSKYDLILLLDIIAHNSFIRYIENKNNDMLVIYESTKELQIKLTNKLYNKEQLFLNYLINMWEKLRVSK